MAVSSGRTWLTGKRDNAHAGMPGHESAQLSTGSAEQRALPDAASARMPPEQSQVRPARPMADELLPTGRGPSPLVKETSLAGDALALEQARVAALAADCLLGNARAWEALVLSQQRRVYGLCYRFTGSSAEAEDLTQDVFLKVYRNLRAFDPKKASFSVWIAALTRNLLVDHYRRSRMERASESLDDPIGGEDNSVTRADRLPDTRDSQEKHVAGGELRARIQGALAQVSPELREAVILRDLEDLDYREIAETLCIPQGTVKSRISRGRAELARLLKGLEGQVM